MMRLMKGAAALAISAALTACGGGGGSPGATGGSTTGVGASFDARVLSSLPSTVATGVTLTGACKGTLALFAADTSNLSLAAGTVIAAQAAGNGVVAAVSSGTPIQNPSDGSRTPTSFTLTVDATSATPVCNAAGTATSNTTMQLLFTSPTGATSTVPLTITYPS